MRHKLGPAHKAWKGDNISLHLLSAPPLCGSASLRETLHFPYHESPRRVARVNVRLRRFENGPGGEQLIL